MTLRIHGKAIPTSRSGAFEIETMVNALTPDKNLRKQLVARFKGEIYEPNLEEFTRRAAPILGLTEKQLNRQFEYTPMQRQRRKRRLSFSSSSSRDDEHDEEEEEPLPPTPMAPRKGKGKEEANYNDLAILMEEEELEDEDDDDDFQSISLDSLVVHGDVIVPTKLVGEHKRIKRNAQVIGSLAQCLMGTVANAAGEVEFRNLIKSTAIPFLLELQKLGPKANVPHSASRAAAAAPMDPRELYFGVSERARMLGLPAVANPAEVGRRAAELFRQEFPGEILPRRQVGDSDIYMNVYTERTAPRTLDVALKEM